MLKKKFRLSKIIKVRGIRNAHSPLFILKFSENGDNLSKFAIVVSKRISKKAVDRNKIRRRISKVLENQINNIKIGYNFIFIAKIQIKDKRLEEIEKGIESLLSQNDFLK